MRLMHVLLALMLTVPVLANAGAGSGDDAVAVYRFDADDEEKDPVTGERTTRDATGNGHDAVVRGAESVNGRFDAAYQFDGYNDYVRVPANFTDDLAEGTISLFLKLDHVIDQHKVFVKNWPGVETYLAILVDVGGTVRVHASPGDRVPNLESGTLLMPDEWYHVVFTWSEDGKRIFINGDLDASDDVSVSAGGGTQARAMLGNDPNAYWKRGMWGLLDEVRFYDRALDADEVAALAGSLSRASPPFAQACVAWDGICVDVYGGVFDKLAP